MRLCWGRHLLACPLYPRRRNAEFSPILLSFSRAAAATHTLANGGTVSRVTLNGAAPAQRCAACRGRCSAGIARRAALHEWMPPGRAA